MIAIINVITTEFCFFQSHLAHSVSTSTNMSLDSYCSSYIFLGFFISTVLCDTPAYTNADYSTKMSNCIDKSIKEKFNVILPVDDVTLVMSTFDAEGFYKLLSEQGVPLDTYGFRSIKSQMKECVNGYYNSNDMDQVSSTRLAEDCTCQALAKHFNFDPNAPPTCAFIGFKGLGDEPYYEGYDKYGLNVRDDGKEKEIWSVTKKGIGSIKSQDGTSCYARLAAMGIDVVESQ
uniref:Uncharacterized protein n=1 Tax=Cacopsylla melanoneura TaxID=428564 RepID=A0A8D8TL65_9HEMI